MRRFVSHATCEAALDLREQGQYLVMGRTRDLWLSKDRCVSPPLWLAHTEARGCGMAQAEPSWGVAPQGVSAAGSSLVCPTEQEAVCSARGSPGQSQGAPRQL